MAGTPWKDTTAWFHSRQKEPAERAFSRLRVRLGKGGGGGWILVGGGFVRDLLEGFGNGKGARRERMGAPFSFLKKTKRVRCAEGRGWRANVKIHMYFLTFNEKFTKST